MNWLSLFRAARRVPATRRVRKAQLCIESLEDRTVPTVFHVNSLADLSIAAGVNADGTIKNTTGVVTLRSAIQAANLTPGGNTIDLDVAGTYKIQLAPTAATESDNQAGEFAILPEGNLTIQNSSGGAVAVSGNSLSRVFDINPADTNNPATHFTDTFSGFTITGGRAIDPTSAVTLDGPTSSGGGIRDQGNQSLTLTNIVITGNLANADGGGLAMENGADAPWKLTITDSTISGNHAGDAGGGVETDGSGLVDIAGSTISGNSCVNQGGGVWLDAIGNDSATLNVTATTLADNTAGGIGGGIGNAGNGAVTITGCTLSGNTSLSSGGGGFGDATTLDTLVVSDSVFAGNLGSNGGGIFVKAASATISNSTFRDNLSGNGGGVFADMSTVLQLSADLFDTNTAVMAGGGVFASGPTTSITDCEFRHNTVSGGSPTAGVGGGGLFADGTTLIATGLTFADNTSGGNGGGLELETTGTGNAASAINDSTFTGNSALNSGGGVNGGGLDADFFHGTVTLVNDTLNGNFATNEGGGFSWGDFGVFQMQNTIVAGNTAGTANPDIDVSMNTITDLGGNLVGILTQNVLFAFPAPATPSQVGTAANPIDPLLGPLTDNGGPTVGAPGDSITLETEALLAGSPAIDKGETTTLTTDERGFLRTVGLAPDIGAFEFQDDALALGITPTPVVILGAGGSFDVTVTNTGGNALPDDNTVLTVTLPPGPLAPGGFTETFTVGPLGAGQSRTFRVALGSTHLGVQGVTATLTSPDGNPATVTASSALTVVLPPPPVVVDPTTPLLNSLSPGSILSAPVASFVSVFVVPVKKHGKKFLELMVVNNTGSFILGRLVLSGLAPQQYGKLLGLSKQQIKALPTFDGAPAIDVFLPPGGEQTVQVPASNFNPLVVSGL
jgi:hypothetical protein